MSIMQISFILELKGDFNYILVVIQFIIIELKIEFKYIKFQF